MLCCTDWKLFGEGIFHYIFGADMTNSPQKIDKLFSDLPTYLKHLIVGFNQGANLIDPDRK